jgi:hypothetical protein
MGAPIKLTIDGQAFLLCCAGCKDRALADPKGTLAKIKSFKEKSALLQPAATSAGTIEDEAEAEIRSALAKLTSEDRKIAESQRFCAVLPNSRLGSMGVPLKLMLEGQAVFLCCEGCKGAAESKPHETLTKALRLKEVNESTKGK